MEVKLNSSNAKKDKQLGMSHGKATHQLRKMIIFNLVQRLGEDVCYRCGKKIENVDELSIEHKIDWLDSSNPVDLFFDLGNIAFSHLNCNVSASYRPTGLRESTPHGRTRYKAGCRCETCISAQHEAQRINREKKREYNKNYQRARYNSDPEFRKKNLEKSNRYNKTHP
jgi:hypothetical protein